MAILYKDKTAILRRYFFELQNAVGLGGHEKAYHRACELWRESNAVPFASKTSYQLRICGYTGLYAASRSGGLGCHNRPT